MSIESLFAEAFAAHQRGEFARAERGYRGLVRSKPFEAQHNLGLVLSAQSRFGEAEQAFRAALAAQPGAPGSRYALAELLLAEGRYAEGWPLWEARREIPELKVPNPAGELDFPEWRGEALAGKRLLVLAEQGFGDSLMFARFLAPLRAEGAEIALFCPDALHRLMARLGVTPLGANPDPAVLRADDWTLLGTIPVRLETRLETLPPPADFGLELTQGGGIGVMPRGSGALIDDQRSPGPRHVARLLKLGRDLSPAATGATDFEDTAQIIAGLDLVISVDTAVAHLAASLGKPTWILLPARGADWRWLRGRDDSPWYRSARLFRQRAPGDWDPVIRRLETALANR